MLFSLGFKYRCLQLIQFPTTDPSPVPLFNFAKNILSIFLALAVGYNPTGPYSSPSLQGFLAFTSTNLNTYNLTNIIHKF